MPLSLSELAENESINWQAIQNELKRNSSNFENLLFKVHLKRKKPCSGILKKNMQAFLCNGYIATNDIRYYNELLWVNNETDYYRTLKAKCDLVFKKNIDSFGHHSHNFDLLKLQVLLKAKALPEKKSYLKGKKIGLIGVPVFFGKIHKTLIGKGATVNQIFIPKHPSKFINLVFHTKTIIKVVSLLYKNTYSYETIKETVEPSLLYDNLKSFHFDIGFHKLNFIIKPNIFNAFKIGLVNDHWGPLPFIRGKSTLVYSILLGFPVIVTTHLVEKGIDTGKIVKLFMYDTLGVKKIKSIKVMVKKELPNRVVESIEHIASPTFNFVENKVSDGLTFYEIHPILKNYTEKKILNNGYQNKGQLLNTNFKSAVPYN